MAKPPDPRYAPNWSTTARLARRLSNGKCCWCRVGECSEVHHVYYWRDGMAIAGREKPGRDVFPVCDNCHVELHSPVLWAQVPDIWARTNTPSTIARLRTIFKEISE
jgi:hypothetical protein